MKSLKSLSSTGNSNPLPVSLQSECSKATSVFTAFCDPSKGLDGGVIPSSVLAKAKGFAFLTVVKAGFVFSARAGSGLVIAKLSDGSWSAPSAIGTAGVGAGLQIGAEMSEFFIILNSRAAVQSFMASGSLTLGGNMSIAAGPLGRNVEGNGTLSSKGGIAAMYSYSRTKGLFGGASVEGSVIVERSDANAKAYGYSVTAKQLLSGSVDAPSFADNLIDTISNYQSSQTNDAWLQGDDEDISRPRDYFERGYSFSNQYSQGGSDTPRGEEREKEGGGGGGGKSKFLGSIGRSRSSTVGSSGSGKKSRSRSGTLNASTNGGPSMGGYNRFEQDFGDEYAREEREKISREGPDDNISEDDDGWNGKGASPKINFGGGDKLKKNVFGGSGNRSRKSSLGTSSSGKKARGEEEKWNLGNNDEGGEKEGRASFDSLDDPNDTSYGRYGGRGLDSEDDERGGDGDAWRPTDTSKPSKSKLKKPFFGGGKSTSTSNSPSFDGNYYDKKNNKKSTSSSSPFADTSSPFASSQDDFSRPSPTTKKSYETKPWDSEDEDLMSFNNQPTSIPVLRTKSDEPPLRGGGRFDMGELEGALNSQNGFGRERKTEVTNTAIGMGMGRSRSGTNGNNGAGAGAAGGLGNAIALYDFNGVEAGDLSFKKNDVIVIVKKEDEEWWTGRLKMKEGIFPRNYVEVE